MKTLYTLQIENNETDQIEYREFVVENGIVPEGIENEVQKLVNKIETKND